MKSIVFLLLSLFSLGTYQQETFIKQNQNLSLEGKWQLVAQKIAIGAEATQWTTVEDGMTVQFNADKSFEQSEHLNCKTGSYTIQDKQFILQYNCPDYSEQMTHIYELKDGFLYTRPVTILCEEGCAYKYKRITN